MMMEEESASSTSISVNSFVAARAQEIVALSLQIDASNSVARKGLAFQHVPKHMRRRAVSHNVKRLPKRLQEAHAGQLAKSSGGPQKKPKKPSRKHRRRKSHLLSEYNRRQRDVKWLETHIWHAKRFHVETKWNWRLPMAPCDKGYRAIYRAFRDYSAMRDISFYSCLEVHGPLEVLCEKFRRISSPAVNPLGIGAQYYANGHREGSLCVYKDKAYPFGYIGEVRFFWVRHSTLWVWVHPGYKTEVLEELINLFELSPALQFSKKPRTDPSHLSLDQMKLEPKDISNPSRWTSPATEITITDLQGGFSRIRLFGPETFSVLKQALYTSPEMTLPSNNPTTWFQEYFQDKSETLKLQGLLWNQVQSSHEFPCQVILPLTVRDPRLFLPQRRTKDLERNERAGGAMETNQDFAQLLDEYWKAASSSPLRDMNLRGRTVNEKISDAELSKRRGELLIPGSELDLKDEENQVPILLIHQGGSGWDLVVPAGWGISFWIALSYRCVRAFGHRDALHHAFEFGSVHSPELPEPDSTFGKQESGADGNQARETFFSFPPAKRQNLVQLKCPFPFQIDWNLLLDYSNSVFRLPSGNEPDSCENTSDYFVLRDTKILKELRNALDQPTSTDFLSYLTHIPAVSRCLIGVGVKMVGKGRPSPLSVICIPGNEEETTNKLKSTIEESQNCNGLEMERKGLRQKHQKEMAFLRKKRKKMRKRARNVHSVDPAGGSSGAQDFDSTNLSRNYNATLQSFFLPRAESTLRTLSRRPIGFLTFGGDSYRMGKSLGFGYVTLFGLFNYLENVTSWKEANIVLVRDATKSLEYRRGKLEVFTTCPS